MCRCPMCRCDYELDESIAVAFTVSPAIGPIAFEPRDLSPSDCHFVYRMTPDGQTPEGMFRSEPVKATEGIGVREVTLNEAAAAQFV